ncbi:MAG: MFS family permease [Patiriisocius sp.]|jgi:MFS family permease
MNARLVANGPLAPLLNPDFRLLLSGFAIGQMLMPLQFITQILWVQHYAPKDIWLILVAFIATSRGLGALIFGLYGGALADRFDRRKLLITIQVLQVLGTVVIAGLMYFSVGGITGFAIFFALTFLTSGLQSIDAPTRLAIVPDVLGHDLAPAGMSLNQVAGQVAMPVAMMATGLIIDIFGFSGAYLFSALGHVIAIVCIHLMAYQSSHAVETGKKYGARQAYADIKFGLSYARNHPVLLWLIVLLVMMMSFGYPATASLGPTWVTTVVGVEIARLGYIVMYWGVGSFIAAVLLTRFATFEKRGWLVGLGAVIFSVSFVVFVYDPTEINAIIGNIGLGAGMTTTMVSSTILIQHVAPNEVRGRIMSIFQLNMAFAQLMTMPVALLAQWLTLPVVLPVLSFITLIVVLVILVAKPQLVRSTIEPGGLQNP